MEDLSDDEKRRFFDLVEAAFRNANAGDVSGLIAFLRSDDLFQTTTLETLKEFLSREMQIEVID